MAVLVDPTTGTGAKVSAAGSLLVSTGDDGLPTYFAKIYHPRLTTAIGANNVLWAIRSAITRTVVFRGGQIKLSVDTTTAGEIGVAMVRYIGADPGSGTLIVPTRMRTLDPDPQTSVIKACTASTALTMTGATVDPVTTAFFHETIPGTAGSQAVVDLTVWSGLELAPGEGVALVAAVTSVPIGYQTSGWLQFSEQL